MLHLRQDKLLQVDILSQRHPACVDAKDAALGLGVRQRELNLPINPARPDECRVQGLYLFVAMITCSTLVIKTHEVDTSKGTLAASQLF